MGRLEGKVVVITGAGSGIGKAMSLAFASEGAKVVMSGRDEKKLEEAAKEVKGEKLLVPADVRKANEVEELFKKAVEKFGRIDVAIANAGFGVVGEVAEFEEKE